jgi:PKD repeat protein
VASYAWDFGDDTTSTAASPSHSYQASGTYQVTLVVKDDKGATGKVSHPVTVTVPAANQPPVAAFTSSCTELVCAFDGSTSADSDGTVASYAWDFGDDATSTVAKPSHTFAAAGSYSVQLTVKDDAGSTDTVTRSVTVTKAANQAPVAAFTSSTSALAVSFDGSTSTDSDGTIASYAWKFGDGSTGTGKTTSRTYAGTGTFSVTLTVTDNTGATKSLTKKVSVAPAKFASDAFDRTAAKWGTADQGGAWTLTGASAYSTNGSVGNVKLGSAGAGATAALSSVSQKNVNVVADITIDKPATGSGTYSSLIVRKVGTSDYRMTFQELPAGAIRLNLTRTVGGTATTLKSLNLSGLTYTAGEPIRVRFTVTGSGTTSLSGKVWKTGTAEPATAQITATDTTASLQVAGGFALYNYLGSSATTFPVTISVDDLLLTSN